MFTYLEAKKYIIENLARDINLHLSGNFKNIGTNFEVFDENLPRSGGPEFNKLFVAFNFWDGWIDARNHDWQYYKGITKADWPKLAQIIIEDIKSDREITDNSILYHFDLRPGKSIFQRLKAKVFPERKR
jgi:hypothetical protein